MLHRRCKIWISAADNRQILRRLRKIWVRICVLDSERPILSQAATEFLPLLNNQDRTPACAADGETKMCGTMPCYSARAVAGLKALAGLENQLVTSYDKLTASHFRFVQSRADYRAAQVFLDGIAQWACAEAGVETALEEEGDDGFVGGEVEAFAAEERKFAGDVDSGDGELHVVAQALEDDFFGDAGEEFGAEGMLGFGEDVAFLRGE